MRGYRLSLLIALVLPGFALADDVAPAPAPQGAPVIEAGSAGANEIILDGWDVRRGNESHPLEPLIRRYYGGIGWEFIGRGSFKEPYDAEMPMGARNMSWMPCWSGAEVSVDRETGQVTVHRLVVGADPGRALDLTACHGQVEGAAIQAFGQGTRQAVVARKDQNAGVERQAITSKRRRHCGRIPNDRS